MTPEWLGILSKGVRLACRGSREVWATVSSSWSGRAPRGTDFLEEPGLGGDAAVHRGGRSAFLWARTSHPSTLGRGKLRPREARGLDKVTLGADPFRPRPGFAALSHPPRLAPSETLGLSPSSPRAAAKPRGGLPSIRRIRGAGSQDLHRRRLLAPPRATRHWSARRPRLGGLAFLTGPPLAFPGSSVRVGFPGKGSPWATPIGWLLRLSRSLSSQ